MADDLAAEVAALRARLDAAEAVSAIQGLKATYADLVDRRFAKGAVVDDAALAALAEEIATLFTPEAVWDGGPVLGVARGRDEIAARMRAPTLTFSRHFFVQPRIEVHGDRATGRWDLLSPCTTSDGRSFWMSGYEDDEYVRTADGTWLHDRMGLTSVFMAPRPDGWGEIFA